MRDENIILEFFQLLLPISVAVSVARYSLKHYFYAI